jgi:hypothetical protein
VSQNQQPREHTPANTTLVNMLCATEMGPITDTGTFSFLNKYKRTAMLDKPAVETTKLNVAEISVMADILENGITVWRVDGATAVKDNWMER